MPELETLLHQSKAELDTLAREAGLDGFSTLDKAGLIIALVEEPLGEDAKAIIRSSKAKLDEQAREAGLRGFSTMSKAELTLALLRRSGSRAASPTSTAWVKVYLEGEVVGYCPPKARAGVYTYLRGAESVETALENARRIGSTAQVRALEQVMETPPPGAEVREPPR